MKAMTTLESIRLYLSALWHTIIWPKTTFGQAVVGYIIFYFVLLWEAETFAEGIAFGAWSILVIQACHSWAKRAIKWWDAHSWYRIRLTVTSHRGMKSFMITVPPDFPKDEEDASSVVARDLLSNIVK